MENGSIYCGTIWFDGMILTGYILNDKVFDLIIYELK